MKLRIQGNSIRLRLLRSDVHRLITEGRVEEKLYMPREEEPFLTYGLEQKPDISEVEVRHEAAALTVAVPGVQAAAWAASEEIGIYGKADLGVKGTLDIVVEKDFSCLDLSDAENVDTFPNPQLDAVC